MPLQQSHSGGAMGNMAHTAIQQPRESNSPVRQELFPFGVFYHGRQP